MAERAARSQCTILLTGETGVGKGHLARWLHERSQRNGGAFIAVNCGAIPESLIDSQLFGHSRGAFSGATHDHPGLVRAAEGGTLFLDEVSELPPSAQVRLLRLLQDREVQPVGHAHPIEVDLRVIAATNADLTDAVSEKAFREDLLFRLDVVRIDMLPLRERSDELTSLLGIFNAEFATLYNQPELVFETDAIDALCGYPWPGNIRQLRTVVERLHVLSPEEEVSVAALVSVGQLHDLSSQPAPPRSLKHVRHDELRRVLRNSGGSVRRAAEVFGVHRSTIYRWLREEAAIEG
jgi:DNA-binding NtrC family response regulator